MKYIRDILYNLPVRFFPLWKIVSCCLTNPTKWPVHPVTIQISLGIHPIWSQLSLSAWESLGPYSYPLVRETLISVISFSLDRHSIFICSITGFRAIDYPSPLVPTRHFHILCKICEHIYRQKLLLAQGGNDML